MSLDPLLSQGLAACARAIAAVGGHWPMAIVPAARLLWLAANEPAAYERAATWTSLDGWVAQGLGVKPSLGIRRLRSLPIALG